MEGWRALGELKRTLVDEGDGSDESGGEKVFEDATLERGELK